MEAITVFVCVVVVALVAEKVAPAIGLLAYPDQHRRHAKPTPIVGGISIALSLIVTHILFDIGLSPLLPALLLIFVIGVIDDRYNLPSSVRFVGQAITIWLLFMGTGVGLNSLGALGFERQVELTSWALPMTIFAGIGVINAINMSDGMDGLLGSLVCLILFAVFLLVPQTEPWVVTVVAGIGAFLCFNLRLNRHQARIFLGDAGSTLLGLLVFYLLVNHSQGSDHAFAPVTALWLMAVPLIDAVAVLVIRPLRGSSPFSADRIHYHHLLQQHGLGVTATLMIVLIVQTAAIGLGVWMNTVGVAEHLQLWLFLTIFLAYLIYLIRVTRASSTKASSDLD